MPKLKKKRLEKEEIESDLGWIVDNWERIRKEGVPGISSNKLMSLIGITSPWGNNGEGIDRHNHFKYMFKCLDPVLLTGDIKKVEQFIADFPKVEEFIFSSDLYNGNNEIRKPVYVP